MSQTANAAQGADYAAMERSLIHAFSTWHNFHEELVKIGNFSTWLSDIDNHTDLVTFFALDDDNTPDYKKALSHQIEFLDGLRQMLEDVQETVETYKEQTQNET